VKVIVGLGNPGKKYQDTRHNIGFQVVDQLARQFLMDVNEPRCDALIGERRGGFEPLVLAKPQTFMNRSGAAVSALLGEFNSTADDLIVVYDDLDLPFGRLRVRPQGSAAGHRGMLSIQEYLADQPFSRVRVGIGRPAEGKAVIDYVLEPFDAIERAVLPEIIDRAADAVACILTEGIMAAMGRFNRAV
jgi:PTH1 family peptidyl-tRNA hydrolase